MMMISMMVMREQVRLITEDISVLPWYWLSATDAEVEADWKDFYTNQRFHIIFIIFILVYDLCHCNSCPGHHLEAEAD